MVLWDGVQKKTCIEESAFLSGSGINVDWSGKERTIEKKEDEL